MTPAERQRLRRLRLDPTPKLTRIKHLFRDLPRDQRAAFLDWLKLRKKI